MEVPVKGGMALYYKKLIELQEKLRERERAHCKKLQFQCRKLIDKDRKRQERNDEIVRSLEDIEMRMLRLTSKTKDLETLRFSKYPLQKYQDLQSGGEEWKKKLSTSNPRSFGGYGDKTQIRTKHSDLDKNPNQSNGEEWRKNLSTSNHNTFGGYDDKTQIRTVNSDLDKNPKQSSEEEWKKKLSTSNNNSFGGYGDKTQIITTNSNLDKNPKQSVYLNKFKNTSDDLNSLAEYMTDSISSRYYKKDDPESIHYPNHSIDSNMKDFEKGIYDKQEKQKSNEDLIPYSPDVRESYDKQIAVNYEELGKFEKNKTYSNISEQRNDIEPESNNRFVNKDQKNHNMQADVYVSVNESDKVSIQDSTETGILANTNADRGISNDWSHTENIKNINKSGYDPEVISNNHDKKEIQISKVNCKQNISGLNTQIPSQGLESPRTHENLETRKGNYLSDLRSEEYQSSKITDKNNQSSFSTEKKPSDYYGDLQVNQQLYPDESTQLNQQRSHEESNQIFETQHGKPSEEPLDGHEQPSEVQYDEHGQPALYPEMQYDAHGQMVQSNKEYLHYDGTEQSDQYPDSSKYLTNSQQYEDNVNDIIHKNDESVVAVESHYQKQVETNQKAEELDDNEKEPQIATETAVPCLEVPGSILGEQVSANNMNERSIRDSNDPTYNDQIQIEDRNLSHDLHSVNEYEPQAHQFEDSGQHGYNENDQPTPQYDENGQLLQEYDQNAIYQYEQQYDNSSHNYGDHNNEEYQQQYGQYDEGQIYQQTEGMHPTGKEDQLYMNQVGQYDEHNPTSQNYQYTEGMNINGVDTGMYMDQDGRYEDDPTHNEQIQIGDRNLSQDLHSVDQYEPQEHQFGDSGQHGYNENDQPISQYDDNGQLLQEYDQKPPQVYQSSGEIIESGENVDEYMGQVEQYDQVDHMPSQAYQQPDTTVTGVEGNVEHILPNDTSEGDETEKNIY